MPTTLPVIQQDYRQRGYGQSSLKGRDWTSGMITTPFVGRGLQLALNAVIKSREIYKMTGNSLLQTTTGVEEVLKLGEYIKADGTFQIIKIYKRLEDLTGLITFTNGSTAVSATGGAFTTELAVGEQVFLKADGRGFAATINSITNDNNLVLSANYTGTGGTLTGTVLSYRIRAVLESGTVIVPSGGAGDVVFSSEVFGYVQIALTGYVTNKVAASTGKNMLRWDGATLTAVTGAPDNPDWIGSEGRRAIVGAEGVVSWSRADGNPITQWTGGSGADVEGEYRVNQPGVPTGYVNTGVGTILSFSSGLERHNIREVDSGGSIFKETRSTEFTYTGPGVAESGHIIKGAYFVYIISKTGLIRVDPTTGNNPKTGQVDYIIGDGAGKIKDYWQSFDITKAVMAYSPKEEMIVVTLASDDVQSNDLLICYHEPTGAVTLKANSNFRSLVTVNRQLYGGSAIDGGLYKVFDDETFQNGFGGDTKLHIISEWDSITSLLQEKVLIDILAAINAGPGIPLTLNIYLNGFIDEPVLSLTFTAEDVDDTGSLISVIGNYILALGNPDDTSNAEKLQRIQGGEPFKIWCWELIEESQSAVVVRDIVGLYEPLETIALEQDLGSASKLFSIS